MKPMCAACPHLRAYKPDFVVEPMFLTSLGEVHHCHMEPDHLQPCRGHLEDRAIQLNLPISKATTPPNSLNAIFL